ncbi:MAG TPA: hypothetical protein VFH89_05120 [Sphingomicrobium sp.]|nr:hypothetical protein [Sphingomicrobium sp.]
MARTTIVAAAILSFGAGTSVATAEAVAPPASTVRGHSVTHRQAQLTVRVPKTATYVGSDRFDLYGVADAEIQVFVEADRNKRLTKLYWIQFESYWPSKPELTHDYTGDRREQHWGATTWVSSGPGSATESPRPGSDTEHVRAILKRAGYTQPAEVMNVRMVQLLDDPRGTGHGRDELMFIYAEDLAPTGATLAELTTDGKPNANWMSIEKGLVERAASAFEVDRK